jgi:hypothetical protein
METATAVITTPSSNFGFVCCTQSVQQLEKFFIENHTSISLNHKLELFGRIETGWNIIQPLILTIEQDENGYYIVSDDKFFIYGYGETQLLAQQDYNASLIEYYQLLEQEEDRPTQAVFNYLQSFLSPV